MKPVVVVNAVSKTYRLDAVEVAALADVSVSITPGRFTVLSGASGSGKTTLLNIIGGIDRADQGSVTVDGQELGQLNDNALTDFRAQRIGYVFQTFNLLPVLSAYENVEYPLLLLGMAPGKRRARVRELLRAVGLASKANHRPGEMSGGQRQRVAVARALATTPALVLADEPTANLDSATGHEIIRLMRRLQRERGISFVFSSHDPQVLDAADDVITLRDGRVLQQRRVRPL
jgi:putative ABC transport system ATP-binding protein